MDATTILMHLLDWPQDRRAEFEDIIANTSEINLELALFQGAQNPEDDDYDPAPSEWVAKYLGTLAV